MPSSTQNVKIGVCKITFDGLDLGYTKGGVEVEVTTDTHKVQVDQFGNTPISEYIMGRNIIVRCPLAETTAENLAATMPGATVAGVTHKKTTVNTGIGTDLRDIAAELRLHPVGLPDSDESEDLVIPLAATAGAMKFAYKLDDERIFNVEFNGYPDDTGKLFHIGYDVTTP
jgi:hypothetical protein